MLSSWAFKSSLTGSGDAAVFPVFLFSPALADLRFLDSGFAGSATFGSDLAPFLTESEDPVSALPCLASFFTFSVVSAFALGSFLAASVLFCFFPSSFFYLSRLAAITSAFNSF